MTTIEKGTAKVSFGEYIKAVRESKGYSINELANKVHFKISDACIWAIENGRTKNPRKETIEILLKGLDVDLEEYKIENKNVKANSEVDVKLEDATNYEKGFFGLLNVPKEVGDLLMAFNEKVCQEADKGSAYIDMKRIQSNAGVLLAKVTRFYDKQKEAQRTIQLKNKDEKIQVRFGVMMDKYHLDKEKITKAICRKKYEDLSQTEGCFVINLLETTWLAENINGTINIKDKVECVAI